MHRRLNRILAAAVVTGALAGGGTALASAATSTSSSRSGAASSATQVPGGKVAHAAAKTHATNGHCPGMTGSSSEFGQQFGGWHSRDVPARRPALGLTVTQLPADVRMAGSSAARSPSCQSALTRGPGGTGAAGGQQARAAAPSPPGSKRTTRR